MVAHASAGWQIALVLLPSFRPSSLLLPRTRCVVAALAWDGPPQRRFLSQQAHMKRVIMLRRCISWPSPPCRLSSQAAGHACIHLRLQRALHAMGAVRPNIFV